MKTVNQKGLLFFSLHKNRKKGKKKNEKHR